MRQRRSNMMARQARKTIAGIIAGAVLASAPLGCGERDPRTQIGEPLATHDTEAQRSKAPPASAKRHDLEGLSDYMLAIRLGRGQTPSDHDRQEPTVRINVAIELGIGQLHSLCPPMEETGEMLASSSLGNECAGERFFTEGQVMEIEGITLVGMSDTGLLFLEDGEARGCHYLSNGEKALFQISGREIEVCCSVGHGWGDVPTIYVRSAGPER